MISSIYRVMNEHALLEAKFYHVSEIYSLPVVKFKILRCSGLVNSRNIEEDFIENYLHPFNILEFHSIGKYIGQQERVWKRKNIAMLCRLDG